VAAGSVRFSMILPLVICIDQDEKVSHTAGENNLIKMLKMPSLEH